MSASHSIHNLSWFYTAMVYNLFLREEVSQTFSLSSLLTPPFF